jgi:hypothetical protein
MVLNSIMGVYVYGEDWSGMFLAVCGSKLAPAPSGWMIEGLVGQKRERTYA